MVMENPISHTQSQTCTHSHTQCNILIVKAERTKKQQKKEGTTTKKKQEKILKTHLY